MSGEISWQALLKKHFGHQQFRPLQLEIIQSLLARRDVFAVMPTGGGKSLCYQLPAVATPGLTLVISPLIALMKDQVDALNATGVPATSLNSSIPAAELRDRLQRLDQGEFKLLYVAPERVVMGDFLQRLERWNISLIAVDEAHCISEWGHDFRPEYRRIPELREVLPGIPILALTATATPRVQNDILSQLRFENAARFLGSFNRPNLHYRVRAKRRALDLIEAFIKQRPNESGILYCLSRKDAERLSEELNLRGVRALPYHAGLSPEQRNQNQEAFIRDEVEVICATIAFGMGINKSNVRFVIHHDLPKNIEGYYQETGRAGRDGLHSDCLLFYTPADAVKLLAFIDQKSTEAERAAAKQQLREMQHYAESVECRRRFLLRYFGEEYSQLNCGNCDRCQGGSPGLDVTTDAKKFLSCVYRVQQRCSFNVGLGTHVAILRGEPNSTIERHQLQELSTYAIGREVDSRIWFSIGKELLRLGFLEKLSSGQIETVSLTTAGRQFLKDTAATVTLPEVFTKAEKKKSRKNRKATTAAPLEPAAANLPLEASPRISTDAPYDESLYEELRRLRAGLAKERSLPAFVIFSDAALRDMCRLYPTTRDEFLEVSGVGEKKASDFWEVFTGTIRTWLSAHPRTAALPKREKAPAPAPRPATSPALSRALFLEGKSVSEIAQLCGLTEGTIYEHFCRTIEAGEPFPIQLMFSEAELAQIREAFQHHQALALKPVFERLGGAIPYGKLRVYQRLFAPPPGETAPI